MAVSANKIAENLRHIRGNIADACARVGRTPDEVRIVAVTKTVDLDTVKNCLEVGLRHFGESRARQLVQRFDEFDAYLQRRRNPLRGTVRWHMIGHLQRNKVKLALRAADVIHSVDSLRLAEEISARAECDERVVDVMLQVSCSHERQKHGCAVAAATHLGEMICSMKYMRLIGLMTMAPLVRDPQRARPTFVRLREVFEEMRHQKVGGMSFRHLSMGMSQDYAVAVEEGATIARIGTALFA